MKVSLIQFEINTENIEENYKKIKEKIKEAMTENPDVILLPETWNTGFRTDGDYSQADNMGEITIPFISELAKKYNVNIIAGSISNNVNGKIYNTSYIFNRSGELIAEYDKTHLFTYSGEHKSFTPGEHLTTFYLDNIKCGIIICYDIRFNGLCKALAEKDIQILFVPVQWPEKRIKHLQLLAMARAVDHQIFTAITNGINGPDNLGGSSMAVDPWGNVLAMAKKEEKIITLDMDLSQIERIRNKIPVQKETRYDLY